jgi:tRNA(Ile)-lysidine synthase
MTAPVGLTARVLAFVRQEALLRPGDRVVVAVSGGSDSVALLHLLRELSEAGEIALAAVAHLNHSLRETADADEAFCRALAQAHGVAFVSERVDVAGRAREQGVSTEDAGRHARYQFFARVADEVGADAVATGHTRDDQAETFLLRLLRGAGPRGLAGIHPRSGRVVRPVLEVSREELRAYLESMGQPFREDETNRDLSIPRNRVRHELLPFLTERFSPRVVDVLAREAEIARHDEDRLHREAIDLASSIVLRSETGESVEVDAGALRSLHRALASRVARLALEVLAEGRFVGFDHVEGLLELGAGQSLSLPGQHAEWRGDRIRLVRWPRTPLPPFSNSFRVSLSIPGEAVLAAQGWAVSAAPGSVSAALGSDPSRGARPAAEALGSDPVQFLRTRWAEGARRGADSSSGPFLEATVDAARLTLPLIVRSRQPGDRVRPLGMGGREKKVQDVLVDRKIDREQRDSLPLVVDGSDRIVWIVGEAVSEDFRVTGPSQGVIFLKARRLGGQG